MALLSYLIDAYEIFPPSAMAASSISRSTFGMVLPFAARPMYEKLGVPWACSLLGFLSLIMCAILFVFVKCSTSLRAKSKFCRYLAQKKGRRRRSGRGSPMGGCRRMWRPGEKNE